MATDIEREMERAAEGGAAEREAHLVTRREAIGRVAAMLGGVAFVGGSGLLAACERTPRAAANGTYQQVGQLSAADVALLDEVADTILPTTARSPGAKAAGTGPFMAIMVRDTYKPREQQIFYDGLRSLDAASQKASGKRFMDATPQQRLALLQQLDREQKAYTDARDAKLKAAAKQVPSTGPAGGAKPGTPAAAGKKLEAKATDANLPDGRQQNAGTADVANGASVQDEVPPAHYFRMVKELAMLGFFTSEPGYTKAMRYVEYPGHFDPAAPYKPGDRAWAPHA